MAKENYFLFDYGRGRAVNEAVADTISCMYQNSFNFYPGQKKNICNIGEYFEGRDKTGIRNHQYRLDIYESDSGYNKDKGIYIIILFSSFYLSILFSIN